MEGLRSKSAASPNGEADLATKLSVREAFQGPVSPDSGDGERRDQVAACNLHLLRPGLAPALRHETDKSCRVL